MPDIISVLTKESANLDPSKLPTAKLSKDGDVQDEPTGSNFDR